MKTDTNPASSWLLSGGFYVKVTCFLRDSVTFLTEDILHVFTGLSALPDRELLGYRQGTALLQTLISTSTLDK